MQPSDADIFSALEYADAHLPASLEKLFSLMRISSISTDPAYAKDCYQAAELLRVELADLGFTARVAETPGHPMVVAHHEGDGPHVLFYGHYDVQPVDPVELWRRPPFDPCLETHDGGNQVIFGRGASDDKGQVYTFIEACRAWKATYGALPCRVTILLEGEEESGSKSLEPFLESNTAELRADFALICDTSMWDRTTPALTIGLRGMAAGEVIVKAASRDLHSGLYGSAARNPIHVLADIVAGLHDETGRVTLNGFYDDVPEIAPDVRAVWKGMGFDGERFLGDVGLRIPAGEADYSVLEQTWARPTAEVNGISGGYTGDGFKTVIPSEAFCKISFRLVGKQDPERIWNSFEEYVRSKIPADCSVRILQNKGSKAISLESDGAPLLAARTALEQEWGKPSALMASGGSIPVVNSIKRILEMDSLMVGFALNDDNIHSPNEKYELQSFHKGIRSWVRILAGLSDTAITSSNSR